MEMWRIMLIKIHVYDNSVKAAYLRHICFPSNWLHRKYTNFSIQSKCHPIIHVSFVLFSVCQRNFRPAVQSGVDKCSWRPATSISVMPGTDRASLLLQRLGRVGAGGPEGLPENGGKGDRKGRHCCEDVYPWLLRHLVHECLKITSCCNY